MLQLDSLCFLLPLLITAALVLKLCFLPMNRIRSLHQVGFAHLPTGTRASRKEAVRGLCRSRNVGHVPPPYPNGWFVLAESHQVPAGQVLQVSALGQQFAVFRGQKSGLVFVSDAYCPHLGANLAVGGQVIQDSIRCPFHLWTFDARQDGLCSSIPYAKKTLPCAKLNMWHAHELHGLILVWHHVDQVPPHWLPEAVPQLDTKQPGHWIYRGRNEFEVACHIQDIPENGSDVAHLDAIHRTPMIGGGEPSQRLEAALNKFLVHEWSIQWAALDRRDGQGHCALINLDHSLKLFNRWNVLKMKVTGKQIGPALVYLFFDSPFGHGVMLQYVTPVAPMLQKLVHVFYSQPSMMSPLAKLILWGESVLVERDIAVWNHKSYKANPIFVKEDTTMAKHRKWYSQFYCENSLTYAEARQPTLDW